MEKWRFFVERDNLVVPKEMRVSWPASLLLFLALSFLLSTFYSFYLLGLKLFNNSGNSSSNTIPPDLLLLAFFFVLLFLLGLLFFLRALVIELKLDIIAIVVVGFLAAFLAIALYFFLNYFSGSDLLSFKFPDFRYRYYGLEVVYAQSQNNDSNYLSSQKLLLHSRDCPELKSEISKARDYFAREPAKVVTRGFLTWEAAVVNGFSLHSNCLLQEKKRFSQNGIDAQLRFAIFYLFEYLVSGLFYFFLPLTLFQLFFFTFTKKHLFIIRR